MKAFAPSRDPGVSNSFGTHISKCSSALLHCRLTPGDEVGACTFLLFNNNGSRDPSSYHQVASAQTYSGA